MAKKLRTQRKKPITGSWKRFGIQNHIGGIWTPETFPTAERGQKYLDAQREAWPRDDDGLGGHQVVPVRVIVTACG